MRSKTMLMHMLIEQTEADVFVIGLIGERGREYHRICCALRIRKQHVLVLLHFRFPLGRSPQCGATGDNRSGIFSRPKRSLIDSMTRYARALRWALASGVRPPAEVIPPPYSIICPLAKRPGATSEEALLPLYGTA